MQTRYLAGTMLLLSAAAWADNRSVAGVYACVSMGSRPCDTSTELQLSPNGNWRWGRYNGTFTISGDTMTFDGVGGLATWGPASIRPDALAFGSGGSRVVWHKPSSSAAADLAAGTYYCRTAPGGCQTAKGIEIAADGTWSWGSSGGSYSVVGSRVLFQGPQLSGWGPADISGNKLVFDSSDGASEWSLSKVSEPNGTALSSEGSLAVPGDKLTFDPNAFDLGCPLSPFDRQRVQDNIEDARAGGASNRTKALAHDQLAEMCRKVGDLKRAEQESLKAEYWRTRGR